jgi:pre-rRNA-processing protein TSR1
MKCVFGLPLKKQDQIKMNLYKRVYPRWTYNSQVSPSPNEPAPMIEHVISQKDVEMVE